MFQSSEINLADVVVKDLHPLMHLLIDFTIRDFKSQQSAVYAFGLGAINFPFYK